MPNSRVKWSHWIQNSDPEETQQIKTALRDFLYLLSGGETNKMLEDILNDGEKEDLPMGNDIEITARRVLSYLSGGQLIPLLHDILYPEEKDLLSERYQVALIRIGEVIRHINPKSKGIILNAIRQAGFTKEELREKGWKFSTNLWNARNTFEEEDEESLDEAATLRPYEPNCFYDNRRFKIISSRLSAYSSEVECINERRRDNPLFPQLKGN
ncbi:unnamed protein product [Lepeophtheirus salmonis]|uniref:(salmon louse) hypothetical protein n=1 Tax=Lepeophtheirus salmonis TaxID=72036 RepID=A0A7R8CED8_LEPSM|nr:unnamed protein product [Lepeophtheirus salmonis]CAF2756618.1 unnamed protein product [Lepeophtheirus salmonis]